jgi:hypothetical protein
LDGEEVVVVQEVEHRPRRESVARGAQRRMSLGITSKVVPAIIDDDES